MPAQKYQLRKILDSLVRDSETEGRLWLKKELPIFFLPSQKALRYLDDIKESMLGLIEGCKSDANENSLLQSSRELYALSTLLLLIEGQSKTIQSVNINEELDSGVVWDRITNFASIPSFIADAEKSLSFIAQSNSAVSSIIHSFTNWSPIMKEVIPCACSGRAEKIQIDYVIRNTLESVYESKNLQLIQYIGVQFDNARHLEMHYKFSKEAFTKYNFLKNVGVPGSAKIRILFLAKSMLCFYDGVFKIVFEDEDYVCAENFYLSMFVEKITKLLDRIN